MRHRDYWLWSGSASVALCAALLSVAGVLYATKAHFSFWANGFTISAYATIFIALLCFIGAIRELAFPFAAKDPPRQRIRLARPQQNEARMHFVTHDAMHLHDPREGARKLEAERVFTSETPKELVAAFKGHTSAQRQILVEYIHQWIRVSGTLNDVGEWTDSHSRVTFRDSSVVMIFKDKNVFDHLLSILRAGDRITVVGQIERIDSIAVQISDCEIESFHG